jgi:hypothetical protein
MSGKNIQPPENLLDGIEEIVSLKQTLSLKDRSKTSANGLYVQSGSLPGYGTQYMAGGKFIARLVFVRKLDGYREIKKYRPGDWENKVNETLELCRALRQQPQNPNSWSPEKKAVYELPVVIDGEMLNRVSDANKQHYRELDRNWQIRGRPRWIEMRDIFLDELRNEWPLEYTELRTNQKDAKKVAESLQVNITKAYAAGYMCGKGWISPEELANANSYLGELLVGDLRDSLRGTKSMSTAFATSLMKISAIGHADAWRDTK